MCYLFISDVKRCENIMLTLVKHSKEHFTISTKKRDLDLKRQMKKIYDNTNLLLRKFSKYSDDVKWYLFKTYCSNL